MSRGLHKNKDLRGIDPQSTKYWEEILRRHGLAMSRGSDCRLRYRGSYIDLAADTKNDPRVSEET